MGRTWITFLVLLSVLTVAPAAYAARRYAVLIGNNTGRGDDVELRHAEDDAARLADVLRRLGGFDAQNTVLALGEPASSIRRALLDVNARIRAEQPMVDEGSVLFVYYSGHADADGLHPGTDPISYDELRAMIVGSAARLRVLILDGCRSGGLTRVKGGRPAPEFRVVTEGRNTAEGLVMISSSAVGEDSHESERLGGSFFTHNLINALLGAGDGNADGAVTLNEAYNYAYVNTLRASGRTASLQHPTYAYEIKGRAEVVITRLDGDRSRSGTVVLAEAGTHLITGDGEDGELIAEVTAEAPGLRLSLPARRYFVQRRARDHYREYEVELAAAKEVELARAPHRDVAYARLVRKGASVTRTHGLYVAAGARGEILDGMGTTMELSAAYGLDLEWASVGARVRAGRSNAGTELGGLPVTGTDFAVGLSVQRFLDLPIFSAGLGLVVEGVRHRQTFETTGIAAPRTGYALAIGALLTLERELVGPLVLRVEGGPVTEILREATRVSGAVRGESTATPLTWTAAVGMGWRI